MPCGPRNSRSSSSRARMRRSFVSPSGDRSRRPATPRVVRRGDVQHQLAVLPQEALGGFGQPGEAARARRPRSTVTAHSGSRPTIERTLRRIGIAAAEAQHVVEEPVLLVPHLVLAVADAIHRGGDPEEVLQIAQRFLLVDRVVASQLEGDLEHALREEHHPRGAVGLLQPPAGGQRPAAIENADVVEPEEAALEGVAAGRVLAVHPPGEVVRQAVKRVAQKADDRRRRAAAARCGRATTPPRRAPAG